MSPFNVPSAAKLPGWVLRIVSIGTVLLWATIAFWGVIFISKGMEDFSSFFPGDRFYAIVYTFIGVVFLLQVRTRVVTLRKYGLTSMVKHFLENRVLEVSATTILMVAVAIIVSLNIKSIVNAVLLMPLFIGTSFGFGLGQFMEQVLNIPYSSFIVLASSWLLQIFWMYLFAWMFVRVFLRFQRLHPLD